MKKYALILILFFCFLPGSAEEGFYVQNMIIGDDDIVITPAETDNNEKKDNSNGYSSELDQKSQGNVQYIPVNYNTYNYNIRPIYPVYGYTIRPYGFTYNYSGNSYNYSGYTFNYGGKGRQVRTFHHYPPQPPPNNGIPPQDNQHGKNPPPPPPTKTQNTETK